LLEDEIQGIDIHPATVCFFASQDHDKFFHPLIPIFSLSTKPSSLTYTSLLPTHLPEDPKFSIDTANP
jgi:hypothetical protein